MRPQNVGNIFAQINDDVMTIENNWQICVNVRMEIFALLGLKVAVRGKDKQKNTLQIDLKQFTV